MPNYNAMSSTVKALQ